MLKMISGKYIFIALGTVSFLGVVGMVYFVFSSPSGNHESTRGSRAL